MTFIPEWLGELTQLKTLDLSHNQLKSLPDGMSKLTQLQDLNLSKNIITFIPDWFGELVQLESLDFGNGNSRVPSWLRENEEGVINGNNNHNQLTDIPVSLSRLTRLRKLVLDGNAITTIPDWLAELPFLESLFIWGNPIIQPPPEQLGDALNNGLVDLDSIRRYYAQLKQAGRAFFFEAKLLIIGEGGAGKTSLARKLIDSKSSLPLPDDSTEGIDILEWQFPVTSEITPQFQDHSDLKIPKGILYQANIWDFGGQSIYHATHQFFLSKRSVYVLLADTRRQHTDFYDWLRMQETFGIDSPVILLKNKNRGTSKQVEIENLPHLRERFPNLDKIIELDLSNVPNEDEWLDLFLYLQKQLMALDHIGIPRPKSWVRIRQTLRQVTNKRGLNSINRRQFLTLCRKFGISDERDAMQLSEYLHNVGDILHFEDDPILANLVILKPTWALDAVYRVLDNEEITFNWGQFSRQQLRTLWHEENYENHREQLLRLMQKFQLCYALRDFPDNFIAPQLLTPEAPNYDWDGDSDDLQLRYRYPIFMPRGILSRAIVALHHRIEDQALVWRTGVILRDEFARAQILELRGEKEIQIRVMGGNKRDLLMEIVRAMDELHRGFSSKLKYEKSVPCRCDMCRSSIDPHFFPLKKLLERLSYRKETIECNNRPYAEVQIRSLIDDAVLQQEMQNGRIHIEGDYINVGNISDSGGLAFGRGASGRQAQE